MEEHGFTGFEKHFEEHEEFRRRIARLREDYHKSGVNLTRDLLNFIKDWLFDHILKTDAEFARFAVWSLTHATTANLKCGQQIGVNRRTF